MSDSRKGSVQGVNKGLMCVYCSGIIDGECLKCIFCDNTFHAKKECSNVTNNICKSILASDHVSYTCMNCKSASFHDIVGRLAIMENELKVLKQQFTLKLSEDICKIVNETIKETHEVLEKKLNVMVFGLEECSDSVEEDVKVAEICSVLEIPTTSISTFSRVGKAEPTKRRPMRLRFESGECKANCLRNSGKLRNYNMQNHSKIYIRHDLTRSQLERDKKLLEEFKSRKDKGENVVLRRGKIVVQTA